MIIDLKQNSLCINSVDIVTEPSFSDLIHILNIKAEECRYSKNNDLGNTVATIDKLGIIMLYTSDNIIDCLALELKPTKDRLKYKNDPKFLYPGELFFNGRPLPANITYTLARMIMKKNKKYFKSINVNFNTQERIATSLTITFKLNRDGNIKPIKYVV
jgi:hypothetical protein